MRHVLFAGPSNVGKSTLINILMNNDIQHHHLSTPARVGDSAHGVTSFFLLRTMTFHIMRIQIQWDLEIIVSRIEISNIH